MKRSLNILLMLLVALPWSVISAGACPMGHTDAKVRSAPEKKHSCCSSKQKGESHETARHSAENVPCSGSCCPVCHLVQDTPQANGDNQILLPFHPRVTGRLPDPVVLHLSSVNTHDIQPLCVGYLHLKIPLPMPLRI